MIIDVHAHALNEAFLFDLTRRPAHGWRAEHDGAGGFSIERTGGQRSSLDKHLHDIPRRLSSLEERDVGLQLIAPPPGFIAWPGGAAGVDLARTLNRHTAAIAVQGEGRLEGMATLALGEPEKAVEELLRTMETYGFRSAIIPSSAGGRPLDDEAFRPLFEFAERRGILLFMHPTSAEPPSRFGMHGIQVLVGWPFETTLAVTRLIFEGVLDRHPGLQLVLAHGGGNLIFLKGRLNSAYEATGWEAHPYYRKNLSQPPGEYYKRLFFDTCSLSSESVDFTIHVAGADRVMFGTDYPFDIGDPEAKRALPALNRLPDQPKRKIFHDNAAGVLAKSA